MKTKIVLILLFFAIMLPIQNAQSDILRTYLLGLNVKYGEGLFQDDYYSMYAQSNTTDPDDEVYLYFPGQETPVFVPYKRQLPSGEHQMLKRFIAPSPGDDWIGTYEFYFGLDEHISTITIAQGDINQLDTVGNPEVTGGNNPTITWNAIPDRDVHHYSIRIYGLLDNGKQDGSNLVFEDLIPFTESDNYSYTYYGDLFGNYEPLVIDIVAVEFMPNWAPPYEIKLNASNYFIKHFADTDSDGISDKVDVEPTVYSSEFNDGTTTGIIVDRSDQTVATTEAANPEEGVLILVYGGTTSAIIETCGGAGQYTMDAGDGMVATCGSVITRVTSGAVETTIEATDGTIATTTLNEGNELEFDQETLTHEIDSSSLNLQGLSVKMAGKSNKYLSHYEDVNGDEILDLVAQFEDADGAMTIGSSSATLIGNLNDGTPIEGFDNICIVP